MKILIIEDHEDILEFLESGLKAEGFVVDATNNGKIGSEMAIVNKYDLIILDLNLPEKNGDIICREIRECGKITPILILTVNTDVDIKVKLLNLGADDYLTKPFSFEELMARTRAILRRPKIMKNALLEFDNLILDTNKQNATYKGKEIYLTIKEFQLLEYLIRRKGEIVSRVSILENAWESDVDLFSNTIEAHVFNLRRKINKNIIKTISGRGYIIG